MDGAIIKAAADGGGRDGGMKRSNSSHSTRQRNAAEAAYLEQTGVQQVISRGRPLSSANYWGVPELLWQPQEPKLAARGQRVLGVGPARQASCGSPV